MVYDSYPGSDPERELFAQLEDLALRVVGDDIDGLLYDVQEESEDRRIQQAVLETLEAHELAGMPNEIIAALVLARLETGVDVNGLSIRLYELAALPAPLGERADRIGLVLGFVGEIANVMNDCMRKADVQTNIIADETLSPEVKRRLLGTLDSLSDEKGIDLDDIDQVGAALAAHHQNRLKDLEHDRLRDDAKAALLASQDEFLRPYSVHAQDPMWRKAITAGVTYITLCLAHGSSPISPAALGVTESLSILRIPYDDYMGLLRQVIEAMEQEKDKSEN